MRSSGIRSDGNALDLLCACVGSNAERRTTLQDRIRVAIVRIATSIPAALSFADLSFVDLSFADLSFADLWFALTFRDPREFTKFLYHPPKITAASHRH